MQLTYKTYLPLIFLNEISALIQPLVSQNDSLLLPYYELADHDHSVVPKSDVYPYVVAVLKKSQYLCSGALIEHNWVLTGADALFLMREAVRELRVRLGTTNYRKGGIVLPVKLVEIHPLFSDTNPQYDIALLKLSQPVKFTQAIKPIRLQKYLRSIDVSHFTVNSWPNPATQRDSNELQTLQSEEIRLRRSLKVWHLHPTDATLCKEELEAMDINATDSLMCLEPAISTFSCSREAGAPVVLNDILWGIVSSFKNEDCEMEPSPSYVVLVAAPEVRSWIYANIVGARWNREFAYKFYLQENKDYSEEYEDEL